MEKGKVHCLVLTKVPHDLVEGETEWKLCKVFSSMSKSKDSLSKEENATRKYKPEIAFTLSDSLSANRRQLNYRKAVVRDSLGFAVNRETVAALVAGVGDKDTQWVLTTNDHLLYFSEKKKLTLDTFFEKQFDETEWKGKMPGLFKLKKTGKRTEVVLASKSKESACDETSGQGISGQSKQPGKALKNDESGRTRTEPWFTFGDGNFDETGRLIDKALRIKTESNSEDPNVKKSMNEHTSSQRKRSVGLSSNIDEESDQGSKRMKYPLETEKPSKYTIPISCSKTNKPMNVTFDGTQKRNESSCSSFEKSASTEPKTQMSHMTSTKDVKKCISPRISKHNTAPELTYDKDSKGEGIRRDAARPSSSCLVKKGSNTDAVLAGTSPKKLSSSNSASKHDDSITNSGRKGQAVVQEKGKSKNSQHKSRSLTPETKHDIARPILFIGDSDLVQIRQYKLCTIKQTIILSVPGARINTIGHNIAECLAHELKADEVIVHVGSENLNDRDKNFKDISGEIEAIGKRVKEKCPNTKFTISGLIQRGKGKDGTRTRINARDVNKMLETYRNKHKWSYINNDNIVPEYLDGIQLNQSGIRRFASNIIDHIRSRERSYRSEHRSGSDIPSLLRQSSSHDLRL